MARSRWLCSSSTRNMLMKIVHPGGHVELHDRPVLVAEIMLRNPRCCIAHPHVFKQPWAVVSPDTTLMPGQKFYVVPISTVRKLQRLSLKHSPSFPPPPSSSSSFSPSPCLDYNSTDSNNGKHKLENTDDEGCAAACWYFKKQRRGLSKDRARVEAENESLSVEWELSSYSVTSETQELNGRARLGHVHRRVTRGSPRRSSFAHWQPSLQSITEEGSN